MNLEDLQGNAEGSQNKDNTEVTEEENDGIMVKVSTQKEGLFFWDKQV